MRYIDALLWAIIGAFAALMLVGCGTHTVEIRERYVPRRPAPNVVSDTTIADIICSRPTPQYPVLGARTCI